VARAAWSGGYASWRGMRSAEVAVADGKPPARLSRGIHERAGRLDTTQIYTTIRPQQRRRVLRGEGGADAERV